MEPTFGKRMVAVHHGDSSIQAEDMEGPDGRDVLRVRIVVRGYAHRELLGEDAWCFVGMLRSFSHLVESGMK